MEVVNAGELLWEKVLSGDHQSFNQLFDQYWEPFFQYAYRTLRNREDAEEVVQELFIHIWNKRTEMPQPVSVAAYLFTCLKNRLLNHLARKRRPLTYLEQAGDKESHLSATEPFEKKNEERFIHTLAQSLPQKMQQVYILHQLKGLSIAEIAVVTGNSEQTIRNQINIAVKKLSPIYKTSLLSIIPFFHFFYHYFNH